MHQVDDQFMDRPARASSRPVPVLVGQLVQQGQELPALRAEQMPNVDRWPEWVRMHTMSLRGTRTHGPKDLLCHVGAPASDSDTFEG